MNVPRNLPKEKRAAWEAGQWVALRLSTSRGFVLQRFMGKHFVMRKGFVYEDREAAERAADQLNAEG